MAQVDPTLSRVGTMLGMGRVALAFRVHLRAAAPSIASAARAAAAIGWIAVVAAEYIGASAGLGVMITNAATSLATPMVIAGMIVIGIVGAGVSALIGWLSRTRLDIVIDASCLTASTRQMRRGPRADASRRTRIRGISITTSRGGRRTDVLNDVSFRSRAARWRASSGLRAAARARCWASRPGCCVRRAGAVRLGRRAGRTRSESIISAWHSSSRACSRG